LWSPAAVVVVKTPAAVVVQAAFARQADSQFQPALLIR
jgi:hypothetical protein